MKHYAKYLMLGLLFGVLIISACSIDLSLQTDPDELDVVEEAWRIIHEDYVDSGQISDEALVRGALNGMIEAVNDPYTAYLGPQESQLSNSEMEGDFSGIGATLTVRNGRPTVVAPIKNSPAEIAGIEPGDIIREVNGESTEGMSLMEVVLKIRGEEGTRVTLTVIHPDAEDSVEIEITRQEIEVPTVQLKMKEGGIAHIMVNSFSKRTGTELQSVIQDAHDADAEGIVLDVRDNPGGVVSAAVEVVSQFIAEGTVVYSLDNEGKRDEWQANEGGLALHMPLVVLINGNSASASEVVAGALQDHKRAKLVGQQTYGKGRMNLVHQLSNGGSLYITYARWYTPDGRQIDNKGIAPDYEVTMEAVEAGDDPQLEFAIIYLNEQA